MKKLILALAVAAAVTLLSADHTLAQTRADSASVLLEAAQRFESEGHLDVADAIMEMILLRFGDTAAAAEVRRVLAVRPPERGERSGNVELQVWSTLYGLWLGVAVPWMAGAEDPEPFGVGLLLGGPAGFLASRAYARSRPLSDGQARAITWGGTWGSWQGFGWAQVLDVGVDTERICPDPSIPCFEQTTGNNTEEVVASMVAGGLAGILAGAALSRRPISSGLASTINFGSLWGTWFGAATSILADLEDDELLAGTLVGGNVGLVSSALLGPDWQLSRNRARLISIAGVAGGLGGAGITLILQPDNDRVAVAIPLAGSILGLAVGAATTRDDVSAARPGEDPSGAAGALVQLENGRWTVDLPTPVPTLVRDESTPGRPVRPAIGLQLMRARF